MKITTQHTAAIARHIADVLGDADTSRAEVALTAIIGEGATYTDLPVVDVMVVTEGLRDAVVSVPAIRRGTITALFTHVREGAPTCKRCGRLRLQLAGSTWQAVTASTCPVDAGLYVAEVVPVVIGWHDGREYPEGTTHDGDGVPLDSSTIRAERGVSPMIDAALRETESTLPDVLAALVSGGASPATALRAVGEPLSQWVSTAQMRAFVRDAKGALGRRTGGAPQPPFAAGAEAPTGPVDPINWQRLTGPQYKALQDALTSAFPSRAKIEQLVSFGLDERLDMIASGGTLGALAFEVIQWTQARGHTRRLFDEARRQNPGNPALIALAARA